MKKELLAPAGDIEAGYAALYYGADAVYLGLKQFSARATAGNFDCDQLNEFTAFAHHLGRKVFVAINTVLQQDEIADLLKNLDICKNCGVDAIIIQDLGVADIVKKYYPELEMHASTQMAVHNKLGALALKNYGFKRVVLARELSLPEIKDIATIPDLELEAFIHGALCYSYSGICQFSSMTEGRSANRGKCLYPCRAEFKTNGNFEHSFSMKDMALEENILKLPVYSLKIEGRKKSPLYVAAVTDYYRNILDGNGAIAEKAQNIKQIFSRPWCKFHLQGKNKEVTDTRFVGHRGLLIGKVESYDGNKITFTPDHEIARHDGLQIDIDGVEKPYGFSLQKLKVQKHFRISAAAGEKVEAILPNKVDGLKTGAAIYLASSSAVKGAYRYKKPKPNEYKQKKQISVIVELEKDIVTARACGMMAEIKGNFELAHNSDKMRQAVKDTFAKTGEYEFELADIEVINSKNIFVPVSKLNDLRRDLYAKIVPEADIATQIAAIEPRQLPITSKWIVKTDDADNLAELDKEKFAEFVLLINPDTRWEDIVKLPKEKLRIALPAVCRKPADFEPLIEKLLANGYKKWEVANYWGLGALPSKGIDLSFDNLIYMFNTQAMLAAKEMGAKRVTLAVEDTLTNMKNLAMEAPLPVTAVVYQDVPLFTSAVCIRSNSCKECLKKPLWIDLKRDGKKYEALSRNCETMVFDSRPFACAKEMKDVRADFYRADFCYKKYASQKVKDICDKLMEFGDIENSAKGNLLRLNEMF